MFTECECVCTCVLIVLLCGNALHSLELYNVGLGVCRGTSIHLHTCTYIFQNI